MNNTIVALSTPVGRSAIAIVRLSGPDSKKIAEKIFSPLPASPNVLQAGKIHTEHFFDQAMCVFFVAPKSFTGEDMVEFHCHGGVVVPSAVIEKCLQLGAVLAQNGEFSKRAFLNGKVNLSGTEGIIEMIDAETISAAKAASSLLQNKLGKQTTAMQDKLLDLLSSLEAALDYPEEDLEAPTAEKIFEISKQLQHQLQALLQTAESGKIVKHGIDIAIVGAPNVGKSSILNALTDFDRAIVSPVAGTTRDTLSHSIVFRDTKFNFVDTAGLRNTSDEIETEGIRRAHLAAQNADLVLYIVDKEDDTSQFDCDKKVLKVFNKCDTFSAPPAAQLCVSAKTGKNIDKLKETIFDLFKVGQINLSQTILTNQRHISCIRSAKESLSQVEKEVFSTTLDCVAIKLREAWDALGQITGVSATEDVIDRIYSKFCLGK